MTCLSRCKWYIEHVSLKSESLSYHLVLSTCPLLSWASHLAHCQPDDPLGPAKQSVTVMVVPLASRMGRAVGSER